MISLKMSKIRGWANIMSLMFLIILLTSCLFPRR